MVNERWAVPTDGEHHLEVSAENAGLSDNSLGDSCLSSVWKTVLEMVDNEVARIHCKEDVLVSVYKNGVVRVVTELVHLRELVVVTEELAGSEHIVGAAVECHMEWSIDGTSVL